MATNGGPTSYRIRKIKFRGRTVPILMQNENGPCPLLAISNILLLQGQLQIHPDYSECRGEQLLQLVAERVLATSSSVTDEVLKAHRTKQIEEVMALLPRLEQGLDVNVKFDAIDGFEYTRELDAFDVLNIPLRHGWLVDPEERGTARALGSLSYNQAVLKVVKALEAALVEEQLHRRGGAASSSAAAGAPMGRSGPRLNLGVEDEDENVMVGEPLPSPGSGLLQVPQVPREGPAGHPDGPAFPPLEAKLSLRAAVACSQVPHPFLSQASITNLLDAHMIEDFLTSSASQLTFFGLSQLQSQVKEGTLGVLFRNNHFSTLLKHEGRLYLLVTDQGYQYEDRVVWERLEDICGDSEFVDGDFVAPGPLVPQAVPPPPSATMTREELDLQAAIQLSTQLPQTQPQHQPQLQHQLQHAQPSDYDEQLRLAMALSAQEAQQRQREPQNPLMYDGNGRASVDGDLGGSWVLTPSAHTTVNTGSAAIGWTDGARGVDEEADLLLALRLQQEEEEAQAQRQQRQMYEQHQLQQQQQARATPMASYATQGPVNPRHTRSPVQVAGQPSRACGDLNVVFSEDELRMAQALAHRHEKERLRQEAKAAKRRAKAGRRGKGCTVQ